MTTEIKTLRTGTVSLKTRYHGTRQHAETARVEEFTILVDGRDDGTREYTYYPPNAATTTTDGSAALPGDLLKKVKWN